MESHHSGAPLPTEVGRALSAGSLGSGWWLTGGGEK